MDDVLGYAGKKVVVTGAASGMGAACVASNAGLGWQQEIEAWMPLVQTPGFASGRAWCQDNPTLIDTGYLPSRKVVNLWVAWRGAQLIADPGIRLNVTNPGPTETAMMPAFEALAGKELIDAFIGPSGRRSVAEEHAGPCCS